MFSAFSSPYSHQTGLAGRRKRARLFTLLLKDDKQCILTVLLEPCFHQTSPRTDQRRIHIEDDVRNPAWCDSSIQFLNIYSTSETLSS